MAVMTHPPRRSRRLVARWAVVPGLALALLATLASGLPVRAATPAATGAACETPLQDLIDQAPAGSDLVVPSCVYRESVTVDKPLTIDGTGATIDGRDASGTVVRDAWMTIAASDVTVRGFTMRYASNKPQTGALRVEPGIARLTIEACDLGFAAGADVSIGVADQSTITGCSIHDAGQLGVHVGGDGTNGIGNAVINDRIFHNNTAGYDPGFEAGGLKATLQKGLVIKGDEVYDNAGPGIWCDIECQDVTISGDRVHDNDDAGIFYEVSQGGVIKDNDVWGNGWQDPDWGWGAGILLSSSGTTTVSGNTVAWNATGIAVISQDRHDWPHSATGISVDDNLIAASRGRYVLAWLQDWSGELFTPASGNGGTANQYWVDGGPGSEGRFAWDGDIGSATSFDATPGGRAGAYVATDAIQGLLDAAGVPLGPSALDVPPPLPTQVIRQAQAHPLVVGVAAAGGVVAVVVVVLAIAVWRRRRRSPAGVAGR